MADFEIEFNDDRRRFKLKSRNKLTHASRGGSTFVAATFSLDKVIPILNLHWTEEASNLYRFLVNFEGGRQWDQTVRFADNKVTLVTFAFLGEWDLDKEVMAIRAFRELLITLTKEYNAIDFSCVPV